MHERRAFGKGVLERDDRGQGLDVGRGMLDRVRRLIAAGGHAGADQFPHESDAIHRQDRPGRRDDAPGGQVHDERPARGFEVCGREGRRDALQHAVCDRAPDEADVEASRRRQVVDEPTLTTEEARILEPLEAPTYRT